MYAQNSMDEYYISIWYVYLYVLVICICIHVNNHMVRWSYYRVVILVTNIATMRNIKAWVGVMYK